MIPKIKLVIYESSYLVRQGLISVLHGFNQLEIIDNYNDLPQFISTVKMLQPNIVITNLNILATIPPKKLKTLKNDNEFVLIGVNCNDTDFNSDLFDEVIDIKDDKQNIIKTLSYFIDNIHKVKVKTKPDNQLSDREKDIVTLVAKGLTNKEIAKELFLSVHTAITHRKNISRKLGIKSASGLTVYAILNKLIEMKDLY